MPTPRGLPNDSVFRLVKDYARRLAQLERRVTQGTNVSNLVSGTAIRVADEAGVFRPGQHGLEAWTCDPALVNAARTLGAGTIYLTRFDLTHAVFSPLLFSFKVAGTAALAVDPAAVGVYTQGGTLVASSSAAVITNTGIQENTLSSWGTAGAESAGTILGGGIYYLAWLMGTITAGTVQVTAWNAYDVEQLNVGTTADLGPACTDYRAAYIAGSVAGTAGDQRLPGTINMGSVTSDSSMLWGALD